MSVRNSARAQGRSATLRIRWRSFLNDHRKAGPLSLSSVLNLLFPADRSSPLYPLLTLLLCPRGCPDPLVSPAVPTAPGAHGPQVDVGVGEVDANLATQH